MTAFLRYSATNHILSVQVELIEQGSVVITSVASFSDNQALPTQADAQTALTGNTVIGGSPITIDDVTVQGNYCSAISSIFSSELLTHLAKQKPKSSSETTHFSKSNNVISAITLIQGLTD